MHTAPVVPGYLLGELIGRGSTASVWAARDRDDRDLAVKVVPIAVGDNEEMLAFELSALAATRTGQEHLVTVHDVIAIQKPVSAVAIVMDRLRHGTLHNLVVTRGHLHPGEVVTVLAPVALTVAQLHDAAVVHGDLSAANIGFDSRGRPVVLDLGVSAVIGTPREEVYGTPGFVAPEVVAGESLTPSADVYAMGALGWYALTGDPPPLPAERPDLADLADGVPAEMVDGLERALHPDPAQRGTARELATRIFDSALPAPITPGSGTSPETMLTHRVRELARDASGASARPRSPHSRRERREELRTRSRAAHLRIVTSLVAAVLLGGVGVAVAATGRGEPSAPAPASLSATPVSVTPVTPVTPLEVLDALVAARAAAWANGEIDALAEVFAADSEALERDVDLLSSAIAGGHHYEGLAFEVTQAQALEESVDRLRIAATVTTTGYAVRTDSSSGTSVEQRGGRSDQVQFVLIRGPAEAWRIGEIRP